MKNSLFNAEGVIPTRKHYVSPMKEKKLRQYEQEKIKFCLNCIKDECNGECREFKRYCRELYRRMCEGTN